MNSAEQVRILLDYAKITTIQRTILKEKMTKTCNVDHALVQEVEWCEEQIKMSQEKVLHVIEGYELHEILPFANNLISSAIGGLMSQINININDREQMASLNAAMSLDEFLGQNGTNPTLEAWIAYCMGCEEDPEDARS